MHIPTQPDGSRAPDAAAPAGVDGLRARRRRLVGQLRAVAYWQRLVQARTDLVVAGLLYSATPVLGSRSLPVPARPVGPVGPAAWPAAGADDLHLLAHPPAGVDVARLLHGLASPGGDGGPGAHLDRLREATTLLAGRRRSLEDELDAVTLALHDRLATDGADEPHRTPASADVGLAAPRR